MSLNVGYDYIHEVEALRGVRMSDEGGPRVANIDLGSSINIWATAVTGGISRRRSKTEKQET